ncbi:glycosyltransferase family 4 protein [Candidatus Fermentibacteria bacterium]|nr:glycosyltransferase family 4 protein [Candidatus Fermentibacteria bacterium]
MTGLSLLFINSAKRASGGEYWMAQVGGEFVRRGHRVTLVCRPFRPWAEHARDLGVTVYEHGLRGDINMNAVVRLGLIMLRQRVELVCTVFEREARLAGMAKRFFPSVSLVQRKVVPRIKNRLQYRASYRYLVDKILASSHSIESQLTRYPWLSPGMVEVVPNGIDLTPFTSFNPSRHVAKRLGIPRGRVIVGSVADLVPSKGHEMLLDSLPKLLLLAPQVHLLLVGEGLMRRRLERKSEEMGLADRVTFAGFRRDIPDVLRNVDVFLLPSRSEGASLAVLEAMAAARPVVVSDVGGNSELVIHGINGFLFPLDDPLMMIQHVALLAANPRLRKRMGTEGRRWAEREFTLDKMIDKVETIFLSTVEGKRKGRGLRHPQ